MRFCDLTNYKTKQRIQARSVVEFCRKSGLNNIDKNAIIHLYPVLREERFCHYDWCLTKYHKAKLKIKDCYDNSYSGYLWEFIEKYKKTISPASLFRLYLGRKKSINQLFLEETKIIKKPLSPFKVVGYSIKTPNNKILKATTITNLHKQIKNQLSWESLSQLVNGRAYAKKGYSVSKIKLERKRVLS